MMMTKHEALTTGIIIIKTFGLYLIYKGNLTVQHILLSFIVYLHDKSFPKQKNIYCSVNMHLVLSFSFANI